MNDRPALLLVLLAPGGPSVDAVGGGGCLIEPKAYQGPIGPYLVRRHTALLEPWQSASTPMATF